MQKIFSAVQFFLGLATNPLAHVAALFVWAYAHSQSFFGQLHSLMQGVIAAVPNITYPSIFGLANRVFPVEETLYGFLVLLALRAWCTAFRWVKSFIPTIS